MEVFEILTQDVSLHELCEKQFFFTNRGLESKVMLPKVFREGARAFEKNLVFF